MNAPGEFVADHSHVRFQEVDKDGNLGSIRPVAECQSQAYATIVAKLLNDAKVDGINT